MALLTGTIGQLQYPSDAIGNPNVVAIDRQHEKLYFLNQNGIRSYDISVVATLSPLLSQAIALSNTNQPQVGFDAAGDLILQTLGANVFVGQPVYKFDAVTLTQVGSPFGTSTAHPVYPTDAVQATSIVCVTVGTVSYAILKEAATVNTAAVIRTDSMTAAGAHPVVSSANQGLSFMCKGQTGGSFGSVFFLDKTLAGAQTTVGLWGLQISSGAETYNIASWPTPNPFISAGQIGLVHASAVDGAQTTMTTEGIGYDPTSNTVVISVLMGDNTSAYIVGLNPSNGAVLWSTAVPGGSGLSILDLAQSRIDVSNLAAMVVSGLVNAVTTSTGQYNADSVTGMNNGYVESDDVSETMIVNTIFSGSGSSLTPASGTPSSFAGWAITDAWPVFPPPAPTASPASVTGPLGGWRGIVGINWLGMALVGDAFAGVIGLSDFAAFTEYGNPMEMLITSPPIQNDRKRIFIRRFEADIQAATADANTPNPQLRLDYSKDGGETWAPLVISRSMGEIGQYTKRLRWLNLGESRSWVLRLTITDPVRRTVIGTYLDIASGIG